jgi:hypothetical protein
MLIFVFARISYGRSGAILAEFAAVPNAPSDVDSANKPAVCATPAPPEPPAASAVAKARLEVGGPEGPEPTRFGDWERNGRCIDF